MPSKRNKRTTRARKKSPPKPTRNETPSPSADIKSKSMPSPLNLDGKPQKILAINLQQEKSPPTKPVSLRRRTTTVLMGKTTPNSPYQDMDQVLVAVDKSTAVPMLFAQAKAKGMVDKVTGRA